jgi:hypothetical protein
MLSYHWLNLWPRLFWIGVLELLVASAVRAKDVRFSIVVDRRGRCEYS